MRRLLPLFVVSLLTLAARSGRAQFAESLVRAPTLKVPETASLTGAYAKTAFGAVDVARGTFGLPGPFVLPAERATPGIALTPDYAPENGLGEWGLGWSLRLEIRRFRSVGLAGFDARDDLDTPWGRAVRGADGTFYMHGLRSRMRIREEAGALIATAPDGTRFVFTSEAGIVSARGTYQWNLSRVETLLGEQTVLTWEKNRSGRPLLRMVAYGARGSLPTQVEVHYEYEPLATPFLDFRAERLIQLTERVRTVEVRVRHAEHGGLERRYDYGLAYEEDPSGPAFYLTSVQRHFASGEQDPPFTFAYERGFLSSDALTPVATSVLDSVLSQLGRDALLPDRASRFDLDGDSVSELEHHRAQAQLRFDGTALQVETLPRDGREDPLCRPAEAATNATRTLLRVRPDDAEPSVLHLLARATETELRVCDRQGHLLGQTRLTGSFRLSDPNLTLGDVNRDGRPDLIRTFGSGYQLVLNESDASGYRFRVLAAERIDTAFSPAATFARDMNGDGQVDIVVRYAGGLGVLFGQGNLTFARQLFPMTFRTAAGTALSPSGYALSFFDGNRDGLEDLVLSQGSVALLFANRGREFVEQPARALRTLPASGYPLIDDLTGSGELTLYHVAPGSVRSVVLTRPASGLMTQADDGQGSRLGFAYARKAPEPGSYGAPVVLAKLTQQAAGEQDLVHRYAVSEPVLHDVTHALIGYRQVRHEAPRRSEHTTLHHDLDVSGLVLDSEELAEGERIVRFVHRTYEARVHQGIRHLRQVDELSGLRSEDGRITLDQTTHTAAFSAELCPTDLTITDLHGSVRRVRTPAAPVGLGDAWHCLISEERFEGRTPEGILRFDSLARTQHDDVGAPTRIEAVSPDETVALQVLTYDADHRLSTLTEPGKGSYVFRYHPRTGVLSAVDSPEAVQSSVSRFDPVSDAVMQMRRDRGGDAFAADYRFDGRERLRMAWDSATHTSEAHPTLRIAYRDTTWTTPGVVWQSQSLGVGQPAMETATYFSGAGARLAEAMASADAQGRAQKQWRSLERPFRREGRIERYVALPSLGASLLDADYDALSTGSRVAREDADGFGQPRTSQRVVQEGVEQDISITRELTPEGLRETRTENGQLVSSSLLDADGRILSRRDEQGFVTAYAYDALGRLTQVTLPSGEVQSVAYDDLGRLARSARDGLGDTVYHYVFGTALLEGMTVSDALGRVERTTLYQRDHAGRVRDELHTLVATGATQTLRYEYDGQIDGQPSDAGQNGHLTRVQGEGFERRFHYDGADRLTRSELRITGFRTVVEEASYHANGADESRTLRVRDAEGEALETVKQTFRYDAYGRPVALDVNGTALLEMRYGDRGQLDRVLTPAGSVYHHYDAATERLRGLTHASATTATDLGWEYDARGHVASEDYGVDDGETRTRVYQYDPRGFLTGVTDAGADEGYDYDRDGRRAQADSTRDVFDALGRLAERTAADGSTRVYRYGARGQLDTAHVRGASLAYTYDHANQRVAKQKNGVTVAAFVGESYLDEDQLVTPVKVGGRLIGLLVNGLFQAVAADLRNSVVRVDGQVSVPSAYGVRKTRLPHAAAVDYAARGYDADLGFVRMGVRDYDPERGEFTTPDPLFLGSIERCVGSPVECNLYGYAGNNPLLFVDPTGTQLFPAEIEREMEAGGRQLSLQAQSAVVEMRAAALAYVDQQIRGGVDHRGQLIVRSETKLSNFADLKLEVAVVGRLITTTRGQHFEGTVTVAAEGTMPIRHPAFVGAKAFLKVEAETGRVSYDMDRGKLSISGSNVSVQGGLRWDHKVGIDGAPLEAKARLELGVTGRMSFEKPNTEVDLTLNARARAEATFGAFRAREEVNYNLKLYDSRVPPP